MEKRAVFWEVRNRNCVTVRCRQIRQRSISNEIRLIVLSSVQKGRQARMEDKPILAQNPLCSHSLEKKNRPLFFAK